MTEDIERKKSLPRYEIATIQKGYSETTYIIRKDRAEKFFERKKEDFKQNENIEKVTFCKIKANENDFIRIPLQKIEREKEK